ncbi:hypothetical protein [Listeria seeligeri]|nr:hypothetical protein [Listeria seeligeri]
MKNLQIRNHILTIYMASKKRFGAAKVKVVLERDYGVSISVGLMKS